MRGPVRTSPHVRVAFAAAPRELNVPAMRPLVTPILSCLLASLAAQDAAAPKTVDHAVFDALLAATVRDERVDYVAIRDQHAPALRAYLDKLSNVVVEALPEREQLAFYFNLYNAAMIAAAVDNLHAEWSPAAADYAVFKAKRIALQGKRVSLDDLEHETLRKKFKEPRLHVALVCGARSCPPLLPRAYRAADLEATLAANLQRFVRDTARNRVDDKAKKLELSRLFDWFKADFGGDAGVKKLLSEQLGRDVTGYAISYLDYDWTLNLAVPAEGWLVVGKQEVGISSAPATDDVLATIKRGELVRALRAVEGSLEVDVPHQPGKRGFIAADLVHKR